MTFPLTADEVLAAVDAANADYLADPDYLAERAAARPVILRTTVRDRYDRRVVLTPALEGPDGRCAIAAEPVLVGSGLRPHAPAAGGWARTLRGVTSDLLAGVRVPVIDRTA